jgi:hypothetical protein
LNLPTRSPSRGDQGQRQRRLHKAFLRYHDPDNWPLLRETLKRMGRADLIGSRPDQLVPAHQQGRGHATAHSRRRQDAAVHHEGVVLNR